MKEKKAENKIEQYEKLLKEVEGFQKTVSEIRGVLKEKKKLLKKSFNCSSLKEAKKLLKKFEGQVDKAKEEFEEDILAFTKEWNNGFDCLQDED